MSETWVNRATTSFGRRSEPRRIVLEAIADLGDHFSAEELLAAVPSTGRATVFRALHSLVDLGLLCQVTLADGSSGYRPSADGHHHHLICTCCGAVSDFSVPGTEDFVQQIRATTGFQVESHSVEAYGLCQRCARQASQAVVAQDGASARPARRAAAAG